MCKVFVNTQTLEMMQMFASLYAYIKPDSDEGSNHVDMEAYLKEEEISKQELSERRALRKDKKQKKEWRRKTLYLSALLVICECLGVLARHNISIPIHIALISMWCFTLTYNFWCKRSKLYKALKRHHIANVILAIMQGIALAFRVLLPIVYLTYVLYSW